MFPTTPTEERRRRLVQLVQMQGFASLSDLAGELDVSESTIRRDVEQLEETGTTKRAHGGVYYTGPSPQLRHYQLRQESQWDKKREIATRGEDLVEVRDRRGRVVGDPAFADAGPVSKAGERLEIPVVPEGVQVDALPGERLLEPREERARRGRVRGGNTRVHDEAQGVEREAARHVEDQPIVNAGAP